MSQCISDSAIKKQGPPSTEPNVVVPHDAKDIKLMVDSAVDILWNNRDGSDASWDKIQYKIDQGKKDDSDEEDELAAKNKASYRHLVFDLTAEALCTTYMDDKRPVETTPWPCLSTAKGVRCRVKPTGLTAEHVKPTIQQHVLRRLGLADDKTEPSRPLKFRRKRRCQPKKSEQLDELVLQDLQEEESDWIDYSLDELNVKMELADSIFNSIVQETVALMTTVKSRHRFEQK